MALYSWSENSLFISRLGGETSTILIERHKDALVDDPVSVEFFDMDGCMTTGIRARDRDYPGPGGIRM